MRSILQLHTNKKMTFYVGSEIDVDVGDTESLGHITSIMQLT